MKNRILIELIKAFLIGTLIYFGFIGYYYMTGYLGDDLSRILNWEEYTRNTIFSVLIYMLNAFWIWYVLDKYNYRIYTPRRFTFSISGTIAVSLIGIFISRLIIIVFLNGENFFKFLANERPSFYVQSLIISIVIAGIFYFFYYYKYRKDTQVKEQKIIARTASARFDALKNQLDPHFLFNSLNVLTSLIHEDPKQAERFTTSLSKVYRYVLEQKNKDLVTVDEELDFARTYARLLKMRFEDGLEFEIPEKASDPEAKIVPLSLQLLLENAVKHNVVASSKPLHIKVHENNNMLVVNNNLQAKQVVKKSSGVGLQNIKQRYGILTDKNVSIQKSEKEFQVAIPMLRNQISVVQSQEDFIQDKRYQRAKERVEAIKGFYSNLLAYIIVIPFLWWLNLRTTDFLWAFFPTFGWGFGVVTHGLEAYGKNPLWGKKWEDRKIKELMEKEDF